MADVVPNGAVEIKLRVKGTCVKCHKRRRSVTQTSVGKICPVCLKNPPLTQYPDCVDCKQRMHSSGTTDGKTSFMCMNTSCTNLGRYNREGERLGNVSSRNG